MKIREIKFRAWSKNDKTMGVPFNMYDELTGLEHYGGWLKDTIFLQYTGLKDKNGVEIYEGDKIRWGNMKNYYIVEYNPDLVCSQAGNGTATGNFARKDCEVIGNIYSNPELLEKS